MNRFWDKVDQSGGPEACWPWLAAVNSRGYGRFGWAAGDTRMAHRVAWELTNGPIEEGLFICHTCDNPPCCNPAHLYQGTHQDNMDDLVRRGRWRVNNPNRRNPDRSHPEEVRAQVRALHAENPSYGTKWIASQVGIGATAVWEILHRE